MLHRSKDLNRVFLLFLLFTFTCPTIVKSQTVMDSTTWQIKGTLLNANFFSMPNLNLELEYFFGEKKDMSLETGAGLIYYSFDENDPALGYKINQKINYLYHKGKKVTQGVGININYASFKVNTLLLTEVSTSNSSYSKYKKLPLYKKRYGGNIEYQIRSHDKLFIEANAGIGIMYYMAESRSSQVIQGAYRNGVFYINHFPMINPIIRVKIGYKLDL